MSEEAAVYSGIYRAKVLATDAAEESKLGRIKAEVYPMLVGAETAQQLKALDPDLTIDGIETEQLPWAIPASPLKTGSGEGYGNFVVPRIGSYIYVFFEAGSIQQPVYFAEALDRIHGIFDERLINYPLRSVFKMPSGIVIYIDDHIREVKILHPVAKYVKINDDEIIACVGNNDENYIKIDNDKNIVLNTSADITINAAGNVTIKGDKVDINP